MKLGVNAAKIAHVIQVDSVVGNGTEKDPVRIVTQYWGLNGDLLFTVDNFANSEIKYNPLRKEQIIECVRDVNKSVANLSYEIEGMIQDLR